MCLLKQYKPIHQKDVAKACCYFFDIGEDNTISVLIGNKKQ
jgi:hypothetical protein